MSPTAHPSRRPFVFILRAFEERVTKDEDEWAPQDEGVCLGGTLTTNIKEVLK